MAGENGQETVDLHSAFAGDPLEESFIRFRRGEFDQNVDAKLKEKGQKILEKYDPAKTKSYRINTHSIFWLVSSIAVFYYTDFYVAVKIDPRVNWLCLYPGIAFLLVSLAIGFFCVFWCHYIKGIEYYEKEYPFIVPVATICFFAGIVCCNVAIWPVWGWFTPLILFFFVMGFMFATTILPI